MSTWVLVNKTFDDDLIKVVHCQKKEFFLGEILDALQLGKLNNMNKKTS
jgi:hypothetical protein